MSVAAWAVWRASAAEGVPQAAPAIIQDGFKLWEKTGPADAFYRWQKGGLLEGGSKYSTLSAYFRRMDRTFGNYKSFEPVDTKHVGERSEIVYLAINFERAAVYGRFVLFRTEQGWVVQNMDFSPRPEALMPWLALQDVNYSQ